MTRKIYANVKPSQRQIDWQELEFYSFIHFGVNTMTGSEWGSGTESPEIFNPENVDTDEWVKTFKDSGMKGVILTCKHHDGFCLWPSAYTDHSVASSPWRKGDGDLVKELADSCAKYGLKFGVYLSPWDKHEASYGQGKAYDDYFVNQLEELLTNYGDIFSVWFDGANGEGPNGKKQLYDWPRYYEVIRKHQPDAVISIMGPDVRWVGNEAGKTRENEWSVIPDSLFDTKMIEQGSQQVDDNKFVTKMADEDEDLGSRRILDKHQGDFIWYPAEVDVSIRPGWFYHEEQDEQVKTVDELFTIFKDSVGNNATLLLNIPPNSHGEIADVDTKALKGLGQKIEQFYAKNYLANAEVTYSSNPPKTEDEAAIFDLPLADTYWESDTADEHPRIELKLPEAVTINHLLLKEYIPEGQRIEKVQISMFLDGKKVNTVDVEAVGYQKIVEFEETEVDQLIYEFLAYRELVTINTLYATHI